jgi:adenosylhomocysteine nucleosidase
LCYFGGSRVQPLRIDDPCILFALERERAPFCREFRPNQTFDGAPCWARFCGPAWLSVLVVETGIGPENVARTLDWLLASPKLGAVPYEPSLLIFAGFAGALTESLHIGDIVLADEIVDESGNRWPTTWPVEPLPGEWTPPLLRGRLVSVNQMAGSAQEKRRLGESHQAIAVEMESASFAERCTKAGMPFACVRAISDEVDAPLSPALTTLLSGGSASPWRVFKALARRPAMLPELLRLARHTRRASQQLGLALGELLTLTLPPDDG